MSNRPEMLMLKKRGNNCRRNPITPHGLAKIISEKRDNQPQITLFFELIEKLIYNRIQKLCYFSIQRDSGFVEEMYNEVCVHVLKAMRRSFNPDKAQVTTWLYPTIRSCCINHNVNNRKHHDGRIDNGAVASVCEGDCSHNSVLENFAFNEDDYEKEQFREEFRREVAGLFEKHQNEKALLYAIFGDPFDKGYMAPERLCLQDVARITSYSKYYVKKFIAENIQPTLVKLCKEKI